MKNITPWRNDSVFIAPLSPACRMCAKGSKMVILITGLCSTRCFYCPLSFKKGGTDRIFADEWELENEQDTKKLIREAESIEATGAGITGGDPLIVWKRVQTYITLLKGTFGEKFNIHLYTSALKNANHLHDLIATGLDEVRFHPLPNTWRSMEKSPISKIVKNTVNTNTDVAIEIPVLPKKEQEILSLITWAETQGVRWVNLNELEFSERNCDAFRNRGFQVKNDISAGVKGSEQTAVKVIKMTQKKDLRIGVHYCSVSFKDGIQLKNRIKRRAQYIAKPYDVIIKDGTLVKGAIYPTSRSLRRVSTILQETYNVPLNLLFIDTEKKRVELAAWLLQKIAPKLTKLEYHCFIVEEYPTVDRLEVERTPVSDL
ncbi:4Fe-4S single cluster domain protein [uncultured archaeon]|nr:4Fe-4S single cluster domain protein [uncultured archaeon]